MKKLLVIGSLFIVITAQNAYATESTPSADIRAKLVEFQKEAASQGAKLLELIKKKLQNKAYIGTIKSKSDTTLTLSTESGPKIVNINQDTVFESDIKTRQKNLQKNLAAEDYVAALGDSDETGVLTAKKVILLNPSPYTLNHKTYLWGQIISISDQLATLKNNEFKNVAISLPVDSDAKLNDFVILTGSKNKNSVFEAGFVYVIPQGIIIKSKKIATPSAKIATPSAKPKKN